MFADDLLLFAEASPEQMMVICSILEMFCGASGQRVSTAKSIVFFSRNVPQPQRATIAAIGSFQCTDNLGRYLGIPIVHGRVQRSLFHGVVARIRSRLSGWSAARLSMAGRTTLVQSVLQAIPTYSMHILKLPRSTCLEIERLCRKFIWGHTEQNRRIHLLRWDLLTRPREMGGLGLRKISEFNMALIGKLGWGIVTRPDDFWVRILRGKYPRRFEANMSLVSRPSDSWLWRSVVEAWKKVSVGVHWVIGDGGSVRFWKDRWLPNSPPLLELTGGLVTDDEADARVRDFVGSNGQWDWQHFSHLLNHSLNLKIASVKAPAPDSFADFPCWSGTSSGEYSVASAYALLTNTQQLVRDEVWKLVWHWKGPQRVRHFLWFVAHNRLLTNEERGSKGLASSTHSHRCPSEPETVLHVLRDCSPARETWNGLISAHLLSNFYSLDLRSWLIAYLRDPDRSIIFGTTCWLLWRWRNKELFQHGFIRPPSPARVCSAVAKGFDYVRILYQKASAYTRREWKHVRWGRPEIGVWKLNTDGASRGNPGLAGAGGLLRDHDGNWISGFTYNIGIATSVVAELWGARWGLHLAWSLGCRDVILEMDSKVVCDILLQRCHAPMMLRPITQDVLGPISRNWTVRIEHVYREGNVCADWMARRATSMELGFHVFDHIPSGLSPLLFGDVVGASIPRLI